MVNSDPEGLCGHVGTWSSKRLKGIYEDMIKRCYNPNRQNYRSYGAKGITVCQEWLDKPWEFNRWAMANGYNDSLSIDRIDPSQGYYPENCQWVSMDYNRKWNSYSQYIVVNGVKDTQSGWCRNLGLYDTALHYYMKTHIADIHGFFAFQTSFCFSSVKMSVYAPTSVGTYPCLF